ncbi:MAG: tRNA-specific 2-thiouridylase [Candidatus Promineifilaceae bacterium]|jgi:tRNA-specific 2-thiouridylase
MPSFKRRVYALSLLNGSLDSQLAVRVLQSQGIAVHGIVFESPFCDLQAARRAAEQLDVVLHIEDFSQSIIAVLSQSQGGCAEEGIMCKEIHGRMIRRALTVMQDLDFDFVATGDVLDQREHVQSLTAFAAIELAQHCPGEVVRPLSGKRLSKTKAEGYGFVSRDELLDLKGRGHKEQKRLADDYDITDFPSPTGGCRLVDPTFCQRLQDLIAHGGLAGVPSLARLRYGRHFRLSPEIKLIVGRNEQDNHYLEGNAELYDLLLKVEKSPGPSALLPFSVEDHDLLRAAAICARYSDAPPHTDVTVKIRSSTGTRHVVVTPATPELVDSLRIG